MDWKRLSALAALDSEMNDLRDQIDGLRERYPFLPHGHLLDVPAGWLPLFRRTCGRLACVVPKDRWGKSFRIESARKREGLLQLEVVGGNQAAAGTVRKATRSSAGICPECRAAALPFTTDKGSQPHCAKCLAGVALRRDLERMLAWPKGVEGSIASGVQVERIPFALREHFERWKAGIPIKGPLQPWHLESWLRTIARSQRSMKNLFD